MNDSCWEGYAVWACNNTFIPKNMSCKNESEYYCEKSHVLFKGACISNNSLWQCDGKYQLEETPCNHQCTNGFKWCFSPREGKCKRFRRDSWICDNICINVNETCLGECGKRTRLINGSCIDKKLTWVCNGGDQLLSSPCRDGQCPINYCLENGNNNLSNKNTIFFYV